MEARQRAAHAALGRDAEIHHSRRPSENSKCLPTNIPSRDGAGTAGTGRLVPDPWWTSPGHNNHAEVFWAITKGRSETLREGFSRLRETDAHTVVLSSEGFAGMRRHHLGDLVELIGGHETEIVYYCRRCSDLIPSQ